jgi:hypothetical protein
MEILDLDNIVLEDLKWMQKENTSFQHLEIQVADSFLMILDMESWRD